MTGRRARIGLLSLLLTATLSWGGSVGETAPTGAVIKVARGTAWMERAGQRYAARVGLGVQTADVLLTGSDGALGITFSDNSLLAIGPGSRVGVIQYVYDPVTQRGQLEVTVYWGTISATSGRVATQAVGAMTVTTPRTLYRIHGTDMVLRVEGGGP